MTEPGPARDSEMAAIEKRHRSIPVEAAGGQRATICLHCRKIWPCDAVKLLAALRAVRAEREQIGND